MGGENVLKKKIAMELQVEKEGNILEFILLCAFTFTLCK